jgi:hypothetical protein
MTARSETIASVGKRKRWLVATCTLAFLLGAVIVWMLIPGANDPVYQGRRLSSWLQKYPHLSPQPMEPVPDGIQRMSREETERFYGRSFGPDVARAHRALLDLGSEAFPLLVQMIGKRETRLQRWRAQARRAIEKHIQITPSGYHVPREQAMSALLDLQRGGCDLASIMPEIEKLTKDSDREISDAARFLVDMIDRERRMTASAKPDTAN